MAKPVILLVEDNDDDALFTEMAFTQARIENPLVRARDGVEALDYLMARGRHAGRDASDLPGVVLLDLNMPRVNGLEVLKTIRSTPGLRSLPVVVLTSSDEDKDRIAAYDHHANSYVCKPISFETFVNTSRQIGTYWLTLNRPLPSAAG